MQTEHGLDASCHGLLDGARPELPRMTAIVAFDPHRGHEGKLWLTFLFLLRNAHRERPVFCFRSHISNRAVATSRV